MNFLVVDDDPAVNRFLSTFLTRKGHGCDALTDSEEVMAWLGAHKCDAVILDIGLPKLDGLSLVPMVREDYPELPIIIFTGLGYDTEFMQTALKNGANGYVSKGLPPDEVYLAIQRVMGRRPKVAAQA